MEMKVLSRIWHVGRLGPGYYAGLQPANPRVFQTIQLSTAHCHYGLFPPVLPRIPDGDYA